MFCYFCVLFGDWGGGWVYLGLYFGLGIIFLGFWVILEFDEFGGFWDFFRVGWRFEMV